MKRQKLTILLYIFALIFVSIMLKEYVLRSLNIIAEAPLHLFLMSFLLEIVEVMLESARLFVLVKSNFFNVVYSYLVGLGTAFLVTPRPVGEVLRAEVMSILLKEDNSKMLAYVSIERILDVLVLLIFSLYIINFIFNIVIVIMPIVAFLMVVMLITVLNNKISLPKIIVKYFEYSKLLLTDKNYIIFAFLITLLLWMVDFARVYIIANVFGIKTSYLDIAAITAISYLSGVLSILPGGLGIYEGTLVGGLVLVGCDLDKALAVTLYERFFSYWLILILSVIMSYTKFKTHQCFDYSK